MTGPETSGPGATERWGADASGNHGVELVGPHLRVRGRLALGRFPRLADLVNHNRGFIVLQDAELCERDGQLTSLRLPELLVNQNEITFIGHAPEPTPQGGTQRAHPPGPRFMRQMVIFTPGHVISGAIHIYREMTLSNFVEAHDPRFLSMTGATARSLLDPSVLIQFDHMLVNRTQFNAIAEPDQVPDQEPGGAGVAQQPPDQPA